MAEAIARGIQLLVALAGAYLLALWFALIVWTFQDIQLRSRSVIAQIFSTLVVVLFFVPGVLIYMILRPRDTLDDAFQRSLEEEYLLQDLDELLLCPTCQHQVEGDFVFCPHCRNALRGSCVSCERLIDLRWDICPYCGSEQYPEDGPLPVSANDGWRAVEHEGVGRFIGQARERLSGHRPRAIPQEAQPPQYHASDWIEQRDDKPDYRQSAELNGAHDVSIDESWETRASAESTTQLENTDELPVMPSRP